jgi:geranylgeranyl diphosphate synthase type II
LAVSPRLKAYLQEKRVQVDRTLDRVLPPEDREPCVIHRSMRYSIFAGGKRLRPILAIAAYRIAGGRQDAILVPACALELIHTYSLIHDDLPCMDDDDFRRGRPTNHKVFGEAMAVLAGDALTALAFECLLAEDRKDCFPEGAQLRAARAVARAIGTVGLVGGQVMDISNDARDGRKQTLEETCARKTGALIETSLECGGLLAGADSRVLGALRRYGRGLGLGFQIIDDVLNVTGDPRQMGKAAHSDQARDMVTFASLLGVEGAREEARRWISEAKSGLDFLGDAAWPLLEIADYVVEREA